MEQHITINPGPDVVRGLRSALGVAVDLGGAGASRWVSQPYADPAPSASRWEAGVEVRGVTQSAPRSRFDGPISVLTVESLCGGLEMNTNEQPWEWSEAPVSVRSVSGPAVACSTFTLGALDPDVVAAEAARRLEVALWPTIEREIWLGSGNKTFSEGESSAVSIGATPLALAIGLLEATFARSHPTERGLIWMPGGSAALLAAAGVRLDARGLTPEGNAVIFTPGVPIWDANAPIDYIDDVDFNNGENGCYEFAIFMTPRLQVRLGALEYDNAGHGTLLNFDHVTNDMWLAARQSFVWQFAGPALFAHAVVPADSPCATFVPEPEPEPEPDPEPDPEPGDGDEGGTGPDGDPELGDG